MGKNKRTVTIKAFSDLRNALEQGKDFFADLRPPRYDRHKMQWVVPQHNGQGTVEHTFDTQAEAEDFYNDHTNQKKETAL